MPQSLKQLYDDGYVFQRTDDELFFTQAAWPLTETQSYNIVILTNQGSISLKTDSKSLKSDQRSLATFKTKVNSVFGHFDFPILLLAATARDKYRKPRTGMWTELLEELDLDEGDSLDRERSFFVGDAGGRAARADVKADHACSDRYAANYRCYEDVLTRR